MNSLISKERRFNGETYFWCGLLLVMLLRAFFFGLEYFTYLDDNNTYGVFFRRNDNIWENIITWYKLYTYRPVAFFADAYITQWFWPVMWLALLFFTVQNFLTVWLFKKVMDISNLPFGFAGIVIVSLTPILLEAVYWIGASTRLVPGMFFSILSCYVLLRFKNEINGGKLLPFIFFALLNLISTGFYEQIVVFNFVFTVIVICLNINEFNRIRKLIVAVPFLSTLVIGVYYIIFWNYGRVASRGEIAGEGMVNSILSAANGIYNILVRQNLSVIVSGIKGFPNIGINIFQGIILIIVTLIIIFSCRFFYKSESGDNSLSVARLAAGICLGVVLAIAPFAPFFVIKNNFMTLRASYPAVFGIAIAAECVIGLIGFIKPLKLFASVITGAVAVCFFAVSVTVINDYRLVEKADDIIYANFLQAFEETGASDDSYIVVLGAKSLYADTSRDGYENISSSDWAFLGKVNALSYEHYFQKILPVKENETIPGNYIENDTLFFAIDDSMEIQRVFLENDSLLFSDKSVYGSLTEEDNGYRFSQLP